MLEHFNLNKLWDDICNLVIRPPRQKYNPQTQLGPKRFKMRNHSAREYERIDFTVKNSRGLQLTCSHYKPVLEQRPSIDMPCVIYLHGNCGSRCDALDAVNLLISHNITVVSMDFSGAGLSEGEYISLGYHERDDVDVVIQKLKRDQTKQEQISKIALWGRSAGAATSIMYASEHQDDIVGVVADSPFTSLEDLIFDLVLREQSWVPRSAINLGITLMSKSISKRAQFDIRDVHPLHHAKKAKVPILVAAAYGDDFIKLRHAEQIYFHYAGEKDIVRFEGDHNSSRPPSFYESVITFFHNILIAQTPLEDPSSPHLPIEAPTIHCIENDGNPSIPSLPALASPSSSSATHDESFFPIVSSVQRHFSKPPNVIFHSSKVSS
mmetsp:Transcript_10180/g.14914  ORF Transcript_10180/g.14914 Transcript_10180/m.14914 type:complete len:380 (+) Transcript_10180:130-1269(+)